MKVSAKTTRPILVCRGGTPALSTSSKLLLSILVIALFALSACLDFGPVREYAALSRQASAGYSGIVEDMYQSCLRSAEYDPPSNGDTPETHCAQWKAVQPGLLHAESTLQDYLVALGKLAGDDKVSYDKNVDALKKECESLTVSGKPVFDSTQVDAVAGLAGFLLKAATDGYRRRELDRAITAQNDNLKMVTGALKGIVGHDYETRLENEEIAVEAFQVRLQRAPEQSLAVEIGRREARRRLLDIETKKEAAGSYIKTLDLIAKGHQELFEHKKDMGSKAVAKLLWDNTSEMVPLIHSMHKAF